jgi:hypothetical protein
VSKLSLSLVKRLTTLHPSLGDVLSILVRERNKMIDKNSTVKNIKGISRYNCAIKIVGKLIEDKGV